MRHSHTKMAAKLQVGIDLILHATEDPARLFAAFEEYGLEEDDFAVSDQTGHFDNPIAVASARLSGEAAVAFAKSLISRIPAEPFDEILDGLGLAASGAGMHIRLDRQEFVNGRLALRQQNPIKIKIFRPVYRKDEIQETYRSLLGSFR